MEQMMTLNCYQICHVIIQRHLEELLEVECEAIVSSIANLISIKVYDDPAKLVNDFLDLITPLAATSIGVNYQGQIDSQSSIPRLLISQALTPLIANLIMEIEAIKQVYTIREYIFRGGFILVKVTGKV